MESEEPLLPNGQSLIEDGEFDALFRRSAKEAAVLFRRAGERQMQPVILAYSDRGAGGQRTQSVIPVERELPDGEEKRRGLAGMGMQAALGKRSLVCAYFVAEAWAKVMSPAEGWRAKAEGLPQPSKAPDRQDMLVIWARTIDGRAAMATAQIMLDGKGRRRMGWLGSEKRLDAK